MYAKWIGDLLSTIWGSYTNFHNYKEQINPYKGINDAWFPFVHTKAENLSEQNYHLCHHLLCAATFL